MEIEDNSSKLNLIRLVFTIPVLSLIIYSITTWSASAAMGAFQWFTSLSMTLFLCLLLIFFLFFATVPDAFRDERSVEYFVEELLYQDRVIVIPTICTHCKTPIQLNRVRWEDEYTLLCQECQAEIKLRILEK